MGMLDGKVAVVTGAGTGIGKGIALELARNGAKVAVNYNSSADGAQDTKKQIEGFGGEAFTIKADVADKVQVIEMMRKTAQAYGGIDILVNNAALQTNRRLFEYDEDAFYSVMKVNVKGYFLCMQAALPFLRQKGAGRIINISSVHAKRPTDFDPVYCMTKGAVKMLTREAALEFKGLGITVNAVEPGYVDIKGPKTGNPRSGVDSFLLEQPRSFRYRKDLPGTPQDIGYMVSFIASDKSGFMNGASIRLDGGNILQ